MLLVVLVYNCNPELYDSLYRGIVLTVITQGVSQENMDQRNRNIEFLRALCNGQLSSYERGKRERY